ncbi:MAG TPA: glycosyltransferase family A protein [Gemmatimonadaceae bacterium]
MQQYSGSQAAIRSSSETSPPAVSVIVPAYGVSEFIGATIRSLQGQTFTDFEVLVINDGSPDTAALRQELAPFADRIMYIERPNGGPGAARNTGLCAARGEFVAFLDGDDLWAPDFLAEQMAFLRRAAEPLDLVYADARLFGTSSEAGRTCMELDPSTGEVTLERLLAGECKILTSTVVARRAAIIGVGMFDEALECAEDYDLWLRLARGGARMAYQCKVLAHRRIHGDNLSGDNIRLCECVLEVLERLSTCTPLRRAERIALDGAIRRVCGELALERGKQSIASGDFSSARRALASANHAYRSWRWRSWKLKLTRLGLQLTPGLLQQAYRLREQRQTQRTRLGAPRMSRL